MVRLLSIGSNLHVVELFILKNSKNWVQQQILYNIFQEDALIAYKKRFIINFTLLIQIGWIKTFQIDMNIISNEEKNKKLILNFFSFSFAHRSWVFELRPRHNFFPWVRIEI